MREDVKGGLQKFRFKFLAESGGLSTMDVLCQVEERWQGKKKKRNYWPFSQLDELFQAFSDSNLNLQDGVTLKFFIECQSLQVYYKLSN
ncbi:hypothetical protein HanHA89_Chr12g0463341 [Helianthus annuus]|nr:hypothetical protein HanHA89_Chr12g0463341 [Helianthus annuus]